MCGDRIVTLDGVGLSAGKDDRPGHLGLGAVGDRGAFGRGLKHHHADVVNALGDRVSRASDGDGALRRVGQHVGGDLDGGARHLADLLDLGAALADKRAALRGGHDEAQGDGGSGDARAAAAVAALHLVELFHLLADEGESFEDGFGGAGDCHDAFGAGSVGNVNFGTRLFSESFHDFSFLADNAANLLAQHYQADGQGYIIVGDHLVHVHD